MTLKSIILGIAVTAVLLAVLVATRLMVLTPVDHEFEIREIETVSLPEPPSAPEEQLVPEDMPPPPPPALVDLRPALDMSQPALLVSTQRSRSATQYRYIFHRSAAFTFTRACRSCPS